MNDFQTLGGVLRSKREEKGFSIRDVSEKLLLRSTIIEQIESGTAHKSIPHVYLLGYIRLYARLLGCEEEIAPFFDELKKEKGKTNLEVPKKEDQKSFFVNPKIALFALFISIFAIFFILEQNLKEKSLKVKEESTIKTASSFDLSYLKQKELTIVCHEKTWICVIVDGKEKKEFMLYPKDVVALSAKEGFDLLIGNAGGVRIIFDGKEVELAGRSGEVKRLKLY